MSYLSTYIKMILEIFKVGQFNIVLEDYRYYKNSENYANCGQLLDMMGVFGK